MQTIGFFHSIKFRLFVAIVSITILFTAAAFFLTQQIDSKRIIESSKVNLRQLEGLNTSLMVDKIEAFKEKAMRLASDNQIIVPYQKGLSFQLNSYLSMLVEKNNLERLALITPDNTIAALTGDQKDQHMPASVFSEEYKIVKNRQNMTFYCAYQKNKPLSLVSFSPVMSGNRVIAVLIISKIVKLHKAFSNAMLISHGKVQSQSQGSAFLKPFICEIIKSPKYGRIYLSDKAIFASKISIPGLKNQNSFLVIGLDQSNAFSKNMQIIFYGVASGLAILLISSVCSFFVGKRFIKPIYQIVNIANKICSNDKNIKWLPDRHDEIGLLNQSLRSMAANFQDNIDRMNIAREEIEAARAKLEASEKLASIGQLAAGIAHEINTPTQYVGDNTKFLQEGFEDILNLTRKFQRLLANTKADRLKEEFISELKQAWQDNDMEFLVKEIPLAIEQSLEGLSRITKIVNGMKQFARPEMEEMTHININQSIKNTITVATNEWKYVAKMETDLDYALPEIPCLPGDFNQVILNLIINAVHAIKDVVDDGTQRKGTIRISTCLDKDWAVIRVSDTGSGIPKKIQQKIFDPFFTTKEVGKGTGQGLAISRSVIVEKHNGTINLESEPDEGTTFIVRLPIKHNPKQSEKT